MFFEYDVEEELLQKNREIEKLEQQVEQCQAEIRRLRCVCREYEEELQSIRENKILWWKISFCDWFYVKINIWKKRTRKGGYKVFLIEIDTRKFDFQGISHEEYLEFFGYRGIKKVGEKQYSVEKLGMFLPAVKVIKSNL